MTKYLRRRRISADADGSFRSKNKRAVGTRSQRAANHGAQA